MAANRRIDDVLGGGGYTNYHRVWRSEEPPPAGMYVKHGNDWVLRGSKYDFDLPDFSSDFWMA